MAEELTWRTCQEYSFRFLLLSKIDPGVLESIHQRSVKLNVN